LIARIQVHRGRTLFGISRLAKPALAGLLAVILLGAGTLLINHASINRCILIAPAIVTSALSAYLPRGKRVRRTSGSYRLRGHYGGMDIGDPTTTIRPACLLTSTAVWTGASLRVEAVMMTASTP